MRAILIVLLSLASGVVSADDEIYEQMDSFFTDFNTSVAVDEMIGRYFSNEVFVVSPSGTDFYSSKDETAKWFGSVLQSIREAGWKRSILKDRALCMIGETSALYGIRYDRVFSNEREVPGSSIYTLEKSNEWRVVAVTVTSADLKLECPE
jgi:hypothetical protein